LFQPGLLFDAFITNIVTGREFISIEDDKFHAERSLVLAHVEEQLLIPHGVKRMSNETTTKDVPHGTCHVLEFVDLSASRSNAPLFCPCHGQRIFLSLTDGVVTPNKRKVNAD
jgi:hypothetical protein